MRIKTKLYIGLLLLVLVAGAGCSSQVYTDPANTGEVSIAPAHSINTTAPFNLSGQVYFDAGPEADVNQFENVQLCLYDENGTALESALLGTFEAPSTVVNFSVRAERVPRYVYVHHPEFRSLGQFDNELLVYNAETDRFGSGTPEDLPFDTDRLTDTRCTPA